MDTSGANILITGATGGLGRQLIHHLTGVGLRPIAHCRESSDTAHLDQHGLEKRTADLRDRPALIELVKGVDAVIHTAAMVDFRKDRLTQFTGINTMAAADLYQAARAAGVKRFVHVSTVAAVGAIPRSGLNGERPRANEDHEWNLDHLRIPYFMTKRSAEIELLRQAEEGGPELVIVNPSIIVAPSRSGDDRTRALRYFSHWFVPDIPNRVNLVDMRDLPPAILAALERGRPGERYILAGDDITAHDLVLLISGILDRAPHLVRIPRPLINIASRGKFLLDRLRGKGKVSVYPDLVRLLDYDWAFSSNKARRELGYKNRPIHVTLEDLLTNNFVGSWMIPDRQPGA